MEDSRTAPAAKPTITNPKLLLWILMAVYVLNFLDRQIVNILAEPISRDLDLSDTQIGLLTGLAFALSIHCWASPSPVMRTIAVPIALV